MDEDPDVSQASVLGIGGVPQDQHGEAGQAAWRPALDREAVGGGEHVPVGRETLPPGRALRAVGGGF